MAGETNVLAVTKSQEKIFERGFKTWCENTAITVRKRMGLDPSSPLSPYDFADQIGVIVWTPEEVPNLNAQTRDYLCSHAGDEWSAVTVQFMGKQIIIVNSRHSGARRVSDVMHELAHIVRGHKPAQVFIQDGFALREFDELQEHEANWLAGCLLLPRTALLNAGYRNEAADDSVKRFGVSKSLYTYRSNVSGVRRQLSRATA